MNAHFAGKRHVYDAVTSFMTSLQYVIQFHILLNSCLSVLEITKLNKSDVER